MPIAAGTKLGPYEIQSAIGAGGMGEVYRAKDVRLNRIVAIKVLPSHLSENAQLKQRFEREAQAISSLSHPNICALYDVGHQNGTDFLVMEYLEGESLAHRLDKGSLPAEAVLRYGTQIAEALDKAHRQGIVHRDLKPGNVMITKSGAKLLDFGLARYNESRVASDGSALETRDNRALTEEGMVLGTVQYMAPEQLEGRPADERTDIFALGNLIYEMTTGRKAFSGTSKAGLMSAILSSEPAPISTVQPLAPVALDRLVRRCLMKDPDDRWQNARDVASELKWIAEDTSRPSAAVPVAIRRKHIERYLFLALLLVLAGLSAYLIATRNPKDTRVLKVTVLPPEKTRITGHLVLSHDGKKIAYVAKSIEGETSLWVRFLDSLQPKRLPGTEDAALPFWSPDDRFLGFFAQGKLKKIDITEGPPQSLADAPAGRGGTWNKDGVILFAPNFTGSTLNTVSSEGGPVAQATDLTDTQTSHRFPWFLPDGKHFLYVTRTKEGGQSGVYISELGSKQSKFLLPYVYNIQYVPQGFLVFLREKNLVARPFDLKKLQFTGEALSIGDKIGFDGASYSFSVSNNNVLSYSNVDLVNTKLVWFDRSGKEIGSVGDAGAYIEPWFSPDEKQVVISRTDTATGHTDVWTVDLLRQNFTRFTFTDANEYGALWSPDGSRIVYSSSRGGNFDLYEKVSSGAGTDEVLFASDHAKFADDWSFDGKYIVFENEDPKTKYDLWILSAGEKNKPRPYLQTEFNEAHAQFSPDGKWIAYGSDEIGRTEIYVRPFPNASEGKWQVSTGGGDQPSWRKDGKELYYLAPDGRLMAVEIELEGSFKAGVPTPLFQTNVTPQPLVGSDRNQYRATADGQRFLVNTLPPEATYSGITIIFNWTSALQK